MWIVVLGLPARCTCQFVGQALGEGAEDVFLVVADWDVFVFGGGGDDFEEATNLRLAIKGKTEELWRRKEKLHTAHLNREINFLPIVV